jgi:short-subunit dehydrogenase
MADDNIFGQVVIVTGASAGIGKALALRLASQGAKLALAARRTGRLEQVAAECRALGGEALIAPTDVSDESQCQALVENTVGEFGGLDMLINNAGLAVLSSLENLPNLDLFRHTMNVNFYGAVHCTYYALPLLKQSRGRIVTVSSVGGKTAAPYNTSYCASKFALHGFFDSLRMELHESGVSVTLVCPWWVVTEFHEALMDKNGEPRGARGRAYYTRRMMTAERCAEIILRAAGKRRREVLMGPGALTNGLKLFAPKFLDWLTIKVFLGPVARRAQEADIF